MKRKLVWELVLYFFTVAIAGSITMALLTGLAASKTYNDLVYNSDKVMAAQLADTINAQNLSREELLDFFGKYPLITMGRNFMGRMRNEENGPNRKAGETVRIILTDNGGNIIFDSRPDGLDLPLPLSKGAAIRRSGIDIAELYVGSMISSRLTEADRFFLGSIYRAIIAAFFAGLAAATVLALILARRITSPLTTLSSAAEEIASGNFSCRVEINRKNEIGILAENFNKMASSLEKDRELQKNMIADTAHELRTPISLIRGRLEMVLEGVYRMDDEVLRQIYDESGELAKLVADMQALRDAELGSGSYSITDISAVELIDDALSSFEAEAGKKSIAMNKDIKGGLPKFKGDYFRLKRVFLNLLDNAFKYSPKDSKIFVRASADIKNVIFEVEDEGPGIAPGEREAVFRRLYRIDKSRNRNSGGSGLGLAICKEIIEFHKGTILAADGKKGALFRITLPHIKYI